MKNLLISVVATVVMMAGSMAFAEEPAVNVNPKMHPNIAAAQRLSRQAYDRIVAAQKANEYDMEGHAQKAKELLDQVNQELKFAAKAANKNKDK